MCLVPANRWPEQPPVLFPLLCQVPSLAKACPYYSATAIGFLLAPQATFRGQEKANEGIIWVWPGFTYPKLTRRAISPQ
jgi:hypothetical protein